MEKKTIGQFIAVLRKANGMTQRQLAEKLNVSDKAISRWERDECAPDLTLIPVIAEIFDVTSDEILRGERAFNTAQPSERDAEKTEKQISRLLDRSKTKLYICSTISVGIAVVGLIAAMICNFGFDRAYIGFYLSCLFYLSAVTCEIISSIVAFHSIKNNDFESENFNDTKRSFIRILCVAVSAVIALFAAAMPLTVFPRDTYMGLGGTTWFQYGALYAAVAAVFCYAGYRLADRIALKKRLYVLTEEEEKAVAVVAPLKKKTTVILIICLLVTFIGQAVINSVPYAAFAQGRRFDDLNEFKEYMETTMWDDGESYIKNEQIDPDFSLNPDDDGVTKYIYDKDGKTVLLQFEHNNKTVTLIEYEWQDNGSLVLVTYTDLQLSRAWQIVDTVNICFIALYFIEIIVCIVLYSLKKQHKSLCWTVTDFSSSSSNPPVK